MAMPRFYVVVAFHDLPRDSLFVGGVPRNDFVRFSIDHIAYAMPAELREALLKFINKSIHPFVRDRGLDWEIHIDDTPRNQWTIQGMRPPTAAQTRKNVGSGKPAVQAGPQQRVEKLKGKTDMSTDFGYDIFVSGSIPQNNQPLPNGDRPVWSPLSTTLIHGRTDAVVVDPPFTREQAHAVIDWVQASNKKVTHIFVTHGHGDHWFTAGMLVDKFGAQIVATAGTIEQMHRNVAMREAVWDRLFPGQIPETNVTAVPAENNRIELEGRPLDIVEVGHTDTDATSVLHVPDLDLVVAGDTVYNGVAPVLSRIGRWWPRQMAVGHRHRREPRAAMDCGWAQEQRSRRQRRSYYFADSGLSQQRRRVALATHHSVGLFQRHGRTLP